VGLARNLLDGHGLTPTPGSPPLGNFPPLWPLVLAAAGTFGADPLHVARWLNPLLAGATTLAVTLAVRRITGSMGKALAAGALVAAGVDVLAYHSSALSEPLFVFLATAGLLALAPALRGRRRAPVLAAGLLCGAAVTTRYVGVALLAAGVVGLALLARPRRPRAALAFAVVALLPFQAWAAWLLHQGDGAPAVREAVYHAADAEYALDGLRTASLWVLPREVPAAARVAALAAAALALAVAAARARRRERGAGLHHPALPGPLAVFAAAYLAVLVLDRLFLDVTGRLDARFLLPLHVVAVVLGLGALRHVDLHGSRLAKTGLSVVLGLQIMAGGVWTYDAITDPSVRPAGLTGELWATSRALERVRELTPDRPVYTNAVDVVWFHTGRTALPLPEKAEFLTGRANPRYDQEVARMGEDLAARDGLVIYVTAAPARRVFLPTPAELDAALDLEVVSRDLVATVFRPPTP
jgi:4-amino-4-deoxy-L-arabinose transferase-like glycosyltransferase